MRHERRNNIIKKIQEQKTVKVQDLINEYKVSIETIREDLTFLEEKGYLKRVYGGAVLYEYYSLVEPENRQRAQINQREKQAIGKMAASLVNDGDSVFIYYGTTAIEAVRSLKDKKNLILITNAVLVAQELMQVSTASNGWKIILLGGELRSGEMTMYGDITISNFRNFNVAKALIGVGGVDLNAGVTDYFYEEASFHRAVIKRANTVIAMADHDKIGVITLNRICNIRDLDILVTDWMVPEDEIKKYQDLGITVYNAPEGE